MPRLGEAAHVVPAARAASLGLVSPDSWIAEYFLLDKQPFAFVYSRVILRQRLLICSSLQPSSPRWCKAKRPVTKAGKQSLQQRRWETCAARPALPAANGAVGCLSYFAMLHFSLLHEWLQPCKSVISRTWNCKRLVKKALHFHGQRTFTQLIS